MGSVDTPAGSYYPLPQQHVTTSPPTQQNGTFTPPSIDIETPILLVGAGPIGMLLAYMLAEYHGHHVTIIEQLSTTTSYPKMEFSNGRTMEILKQIGLASGLRALGVPESYDLDEVIVTGLTPSSQSLARWHRPSPTDIRKKSKSINDGTFASEPYMRLSQIIMEKHLRSIISNHRRIRCLYNHKFLSLTETADSVVASVLNTESNTPLTIQSTYLIGTDGGGSLVRASINRTAERRALEDLHFLLVHFKSRSFDALWRHGRYWHLMALNGAICVNQDEEGGTWTVHMIVAEKTDPEGYDATEFVREALRGIHEDDVVEGVVLDEVLKKGKWSSQVAVADGFVSEGGRVVLAGDAAHQLSPVGGHGFNSGVNDIWGLSWMVDACLAGWAGANGKELFEAYEAEREPIAHHNVSAVHRATTEVLFRMMGLTEKYGKEVLLSESEEGKRAREKCDKEMEECIWMHDQNGTILGYRYLDSPIVVYGDEGEGEQFAVHPQRFRPGTRPGIKAPSVFLKDGKTNIVDLYGKGFTVVDFTKDGEAGCVFEKVAEQMKVPLTNLHLLDESHVRKVWERDVVLLRPDAFVGWRIGEDGKKVTEDEAKRILQIVTANRTKET